MLTKNIKRYLILELRFLLILFIFLGVIFFVWNKLETNFLEKKLKLEFQKQKIQNQIRLEQEKLRKRKELQDYLNSLDLETDSSITKFVNNKIHFNNLSYIPENLVSVWSKHVIDWKWGYIKVRKVLKEHLEYMAQDFYKDTWNNIIIVSGYRSYYYQKWIKDRGCSDNLCAKAWYSEHQSGLAIDIYSASSKENWANNNNLRKYYKWFKKNAWKYWFTNTYQKWLAIDWYEIEPWHWRYIGQKLAKYLLDNNMTFAEFYDKQKNKEKFEK